MTNNRVDAIKELLDKRYGFEEREDYPTYNEEVAQEIASLYPQPPSQLREADISNLLEKAEDVWCEISDTLPDCSGRRTYWCGRIRQALIRTILAKLQAPTPEGILDCLLSDEEIARVLWEVGILNRNLEWETVKDFVPAFNMDGEKTVAKAQLNSPKLLAFIQQERDRAREEVIAEIKIQCPLQDGGCWEALEPKRGGE